MSISVPQVFISSTSEFAAEREQLKRQIESLPDFRLQAYTYEADAAGAEPPERRLRKILEDSEIFLLILGDTFGSPYPGRPTSIVEWEYDYAKARRKELKGYVKDPLGPSADPRQKEFVARAAAFRSGSWLRKFGGAQQLIDRVVADLKSWVADAATLWILERPERNRWKDRVVLGASAVVGVATVAGMVAGVLTDVPLEKLALLFACGVSVFGGLLWLLRSAEF